jgi:hypothetical protein
MSSTGYGKAAGADAVKSKLSLRYVGAGGLAGEGLWTSIRGAGICIVSCLPDLDVGFDLLLAVNEGYVSKRSALNEGE